MAQGVPKSFIADEPEQEVLPKSFVPDTSHGASGSWGPPMDVAERFQTEHPLLSSPLTAVARFGKGAVDAVSGVVHAFTEPARPEERSFVGYGGPFGLAAHRLFIQPHVEQARKAVNAPTGVEAFGHGLAASIPMIGPFAAGLTEQIVSGDLPITEAAGQVAGGAMLPKLAGEVARGGRGAARLNQALPESAISAASTMIESGVKNDLVNSYAEQSIPIWKQAAAELGKSAEQFPKRGTTEVGRRALREGGEHAIQIADHAVEISDRPFQDVLKRYGKSTIERAGTPAGMTVKGQILSSLDQAISENSNNPALSRAIKDLRGRVEKATNFNDLQSLKVLANKKAAGLFDRSLGQQINASADAAYSWKVLGDAIRADMYPELSSLSGIDLSKAGRIEGVVMDARDGLRKHFYKDVLNPHNKRMQQNYWQYVRDGSLAHRSLVKRALMLDPTPAGMFNTRFRQVMGGQFPEATGLPTPAPAPLPAPRTMTGAQAELVPSQTLPGPLFRNLERTPPAVTPQQEYLNQQRQKQIYQAGAPVPEKGQLSLMRGMGESAAPQSVMGVGQTPPRFNPMERSSYKLTDLRTMLKDTQDFIKNNPHHPDVTELMRDLELVKDELSRRITARK